MKYGVREITNVTMRAKSTIRFGNKTFYKDEPVLYFDSLKTSSLEGATTTVYATGGRGNVRLVAWEGEKTLTFNMEDALISPESFSVLSGAGLIEENGYVKHQSNNEGLSPDTYYLDEDAVYIEEPGYYLANKDAFRFTIPTNKPVELTIKCINDVTSGAITDENYDEFEKYLKTNGYNDEANDWYELVRSREAADDYMRWVKNLAENITIGVFVDGKCITDFELSEQSNSITVTSTTGEVECIALVDSIEQLGIVRTQGQIWDEHDNWPLFYFDLTGKVVNGYAHVSETVVITKDESDIYYVSISKPHYGTIYLKSLKNMLKNTVIEEKDKISSKTEYQYEDGDVRGDLFVGQAIADYYTPIYNKTIKTLSIGMESFGSNFYLEADTLFRDTNGSDHPALFTIPNCKVQSNFTFTMASSGDPSTFSFVLDAFPGYTRFDDSKKVLASLVIVENGDIKELDSYRV